MSEPIKLEYTVPGDDFTRAGEASAHCKSTLKKLGIAPDAVRRVAIALYEGEINLAIHAHGGHIEMIIEEQCITLHLWDNGPGIADISLAMQEGYSTAPDEIRALGFGAGMGLPNMKRYTDTFEITSTLGVGTDIQMTVQL